MAQYLSACAATASARATKPQGITNGRDSSHGSATQHPRNAVWKTVMNR